MKIARLIFIGQPVLSSSLQEQIAESLSAQLHSDNDGGLNELVDQIKDAWQHQGYFKAEVKLSGIQELGRSADSRTVAITVNIAAGKQYRLDEIHFKTDVFGSGNQAAPPAGPTEVRGHFSEEELRRFFRVQQGDLFDTHKIQAGINELRKAYGARGFINMSFVPTFELDAKSSRVLLNLEIEEGQQFRIGKVQVVGSEPAAIHTLLGAFGMAPGAIFDTSHLDALNDEIQALLPGRFEPEDDVERRTHQDRGTVDLTFRIPPCTAP